MHPASLWASASGLSDRGILPGHLHIFPGGLLFPYYVGIIIALRDELGLLDASVPVAGASAGSLIAATCKSGISESDLIQATMDLAR